MSEILQPKPIFPCSGNDRPSILGRMFRSTRCRYPTRETPTINHRCANDGSEGGLHGSRLEGKGSS